MLSCKYMENNNQSFFSPFILKFSQIIYFVDIWMAWYAVALWWVNANKVYKNMLQLLAGRGIQSNITHTAKFTDLAPSVTKTQSQTLFFGLSQPPNLPKNVLYAVHNLHIFSISDKNLLIFQVIFQQYDQKQKYMQSIYSATAVMTTECN